jgi:histidinol phosphatase-like enzyme
LRVPGSPSDVEILPGRREVLEQYHQQGWRLLGLSWQPEIAAGTATLAQVDGCFAALPELLGLPIELLYCPHGGGPPVCWCRKPLPGLGVVFIQRHRLDASQCEYVGDGPQDAGFARRLGFRYREAIDLFGAGAGR